MVKLISFCVIAAVLAHSGKCATIFFSSIFCVVYCQFFFLKFESFINLYFRNAFLIVYRQF